MKHVAYQLILGTLSGWGLLAQAQVSLVGTPYQQSFNTLGSGLPAGWSLRTGASATGLGTAVAYAPAAFNWSSTTAGFHNYASPSGLAPGATSAAQAASGDRALGIRQGSAFGDPGAAVVLEIAHTTGWQALSFSFDFLVLDEEGRSTLWTADYALGTTPSVFTSLGTFSREVWGTQAESFFLPAVVNDRADTLWIRLAALQGSSGSGSRDTYAFDNFQLTYAPIPEPATWSFLTAVGLLACGLARSRRAAR